MLARGKSLSAYEGLSPMTSLIAVDMEEEIAVVELAYFWTLLWKDKTAQLQRGGRS
jgi:hypothetical protein